MTIKERDKPCHCGHSESMHDMPSRIYGKWYERGTCWYEHQNKELHPCRKFKLDNLKYLELQYESRIK